MYDAQDVASTAVEVAYLLPCYSNYPSSDVRKAELDAQVSLLRDIFGKPFRPAQCDPAWLTADVVRLAHAAYDERILPSGELDAQRLLAEKPTPRAYFDQMTGLYPDRLNVGPVWYTAVALLILVVALLASALPTLRATRANPLDALRMA